MKYRKLSQIFSGESMEQNDLKTYAHAFFGLKSTQIEIFKPKIGYFLSKKLRSLNLFNLINDSITYLNNV